MTARLRVLLLEDNPSDAELIRHELARAGFEFDCDWVSTEREFMERVGDAYDLILADYHLPGFDGLRALRAARSRSDTPFVLVTGTIQDHEAVEAIRNGADDYLLKDRLARLGPAVTRAFEQRRLRAEEVRAKEALTTAEEKYRVLVETSMDGVVIANEQGAVEYANGAAEKIFGYEQHEFLGKDASLLQPARLRDAQEDSFRTNLDFTAPAFGERVETTGVRRDGSEFPLEIAFSSVVLGGRQLLAFFLRDVTERKAQQERILRLNRVQGVLSAVNTTIVRTTEPQELLEKACRIAVEQGQFGIAWVGWFDASSEEVVPVASAGLEEGALAQFAKLRISAGTPQWGGAVARAIRTKQPVHVDDITVDPGAGGERRREAIQRGYRSIIALPLIVDDQVVAVLCMFAKEPAFFDAQEIELLTDLAGNISFALKSINRQDRLDLL